MKIILENVRLMTNANFEISYNFLHDQVSEIIRKELFKRGIMADIIIAR